MALSFSSIMSRIPKVTVSTQRIVTSQDAGGGPVTQYADYLSGISMSMQLAGGGEKTGAIISSSGSGNAYCDYVDIIETDRIIYNSRVFDVLNVINVNELNIFLQLDLGEVDPSSIEADSE